MRPDGASVMDAWSLMYGHRYDEAFVLVGALHQEAQAQGGSAGHPSSPSHLLSMWGKLAERHAPARAALVRERDRLAALLLDGPADRALFRQIASVDDSLGDAAHLRRLFLQVLERDAAQASAYAHAAMPALIEAGDFALAERFLPDPERVVRSESEHLNREFASRRRRAYTAAPRIPASIHNYAAEIGKIVTVLEGRGRGADARRILAMAIDAIPATTIRRAVRTALLPGATPWYARGRPGERSFYMKERRADRLAARAGSKQLLGQRAAA